VKLTADTNLLVRAMTEDDPHQSRLAQNELAQAELVAVTLDKRAVALLQARGKNARLLL
jgi:predicted nucleic-acid-binding protein